MALDDCRLSNINTPPQTEQSRKRGLITERRKKNIMDLNGDRGGHTDAITKKIEAMGLDWFRE